MLNYLRHKNINYSNHGLNQGTVQDQIFYNLSFHTSMSFETAPRTVFDTHDTDLWDNFKNIKIIMNYKLNKIIYLIINHLNIRFVLTFGY